MHVHRTQTMHMIASSARPFSCIVCGSQADIVMKMGDVSAAFCTIHLLARNRGL